MFYGVVMDVIDMPRTIKLISDLMSDQRIK
jgi:hypothetical protein